MDEVEIMKFINKEAAKQRRAKVNRMAGVAFGEQALRSYTAAQKKPPARWSSSTHAQEEKSHQTKNLLNSNGTGPGLSQHCSASMFLSQTINL